MSVPTGVAFRPPSGSGETCPSCGGLALEYVTQGLRARLRRLVKGLPYQCVKCGARFWKRKEEDKAGKTARGVRPFGETRSLDYRDFHAARKAGRAAAEEGKARTSNPYEPSSSLGKTWLASYDDASYEGALRAGRIEDAIKRLRSQEPEAS